MPIDRNGDLIFDVDEAQALHNNVVKMIGDAIGVDVMTTFADVDVADLSDKSNVSSVDALERVERSVYNEAGVSQLQFNTDGNIALEKSIANDEATMMNLIYQLEEFAERLLVPFNKNVKRLKYSFRILPTTIYNFKELSKIYKEQTQLGFSKVLPQVALGHSQSEIIATALFENKIMDLNELFVAPQMSSTMSGGNKASSSSSSSSAASKGPGRPELPDDQKSTKTIQNKESASQKSELKNMLKNSSIATIDSPEFIQLKPYNHLISECEIKVCYVGLNRNGSYISKETAKQIASTLPGTPIVAYFDEGKDDFGDHGTVVTIEDGEIKFSCKTVPYGFIAPDAKV